jgi:hypothetical protein
MMVRHRNRLTAVLAMGLVVLSLQSHAELMTGSVTDSPINPDQRLAGRFGANAITDWTSATSFYDLRV